MKKSVLKKTFFASIMITAPLIFAITLLTGYYYIKARSEYENSIRYRGSGFITADPVTGYSLKPESEVHFKGYPEWSFYSDGRGLRVGGPGEETADRVDILATGGSFTFGAGVNDGETYLRIVEAVLDAEAANAAVPAYGTTASYLTLEKYADLEPRVVVYGFIARHLRRTVLPCAPDRADLCLPTAFVDFEDGETPFIRDPPPFSDFYCDYINYVRRPHKFGLNDLLWSFRRDMAVISGGSAETINEELGRAYNPVLREKALSFVLEKTLDHCEESGAALVVVYMPYPGKIKPCPRELLDVMGRKRFRKSVLVDVTRSFREYERINGRGSLRVSREDSHPGPAGHRLIAEELIPVVGDLPGIRRGK